MSCGKDDDEEDVITGGTDGCLFYWYLEAG